MDKPFLYTKSVPIEWSMSQVTEFLKQIREVGALDDMVAAADAAALSVSIPAETINFVKQFLFSNNFYLKSEPIKNVVLCATCFSVGHKPPVFPELPKDGGAEIAGGGRKGIAALTIDAVIEHMKGADWLQKKVAAEVQWDFIKSLSVVDGVLAHMHFGPLKSQVSTLEWTHVLTWLRVTNETFHQNINRYCQAESQSTGCIQVDDSYCNPNSCTGG